MTSRTDSSAAGSLNPAASVESRLAAIETAYQSALREIAELNARDTLKTQFLANISHDLRTPLTAIITHAEILRSLRTTLAGRTAVIASHRISALRDASWIIVLDDGRVVEQGVHGELMAARGRYWRLLRRQELEESIARGGDEDTPDEDTLLAEPASTDRFGA